MGVKKTKAQKEHGLLDKFSGARNFNTSEWSVSTPRGLEFDYVIHGTCRDAILGLKLNSDATANNRQYNMQGLASTASASVNDATTITQAFGSTTSGKPSAFRLILTGDSDTEKYINSFASINGAINVQAIYWKNNTSDLSNITIFDSVSRTSNAEIWIEQIPKQASLKNYDFIESGSCNQDIYASPFYISSSLSGDTDKEYLLVIENFTVSAGDGWIQFNSDTGANYTGEELRNSSGTISSQNRASYTRIQMGDTGTNSSNHIFKINAESGGERLTEYSLSQITSAFQQVESAWLWSDTSNELTSIRVTASTTAIGVFDYELYKRKSNKTIDPVPMKTVVEYDISGVDFSSGITISNIEGDRIDGAIKIECLDMIGNTNVLLQANSITSNTNQQLKASSSTASASSTSPTALIICNGSTSVNCSKTWIYPKSGQNRPCLNEQCSNETILEKNAMLINDSSNELASMTIYASSTTSLTGKIRISVPENTKQASPSWTVTTN